MKKDGGNQERKTNFCRRLLTCGIQAFAQCQVTTTHLSKHGEATPTLGALASGHVCQSEDLKSKRSSTQNVATVKEFT